MFDPSQLLNAMMTGGMRGSPLAEVLKGVLGGGVSGGGGFADARPAGGNPLGSILGELLGGGAAGSGGGGLGGAGLGGGGLGGGGMGGALAQVLGGVLGGGAPAASRSDGGGILGTLLGGILGGSGGRGAGLGSSGGLGGLGGMGSSGGLGGMAGAALISALASALLNRGSGAQAAVAPQQAIDAAVPSDPGRAARQALLLIRAMIAAAKADGAIDDEERRRIVGKLREAGADATACAFVEAEMARPSSIDALIADIPDQMTAAQVYMASLFAIDVDTQAEKAYLATLAKRLGLPAMTA